MKKYKASNLIEANSVGTVSLRTVQGEQGEYVQGGYVGELFTGV